VLCKPNRAIQFHSISPVRFALFPLLYAFNLNALNVWGIMGEFDTLLMHVFDKRFRPPTLGCFLWAFCELKGHDSCGYILIWGQLLITLFCFSNLFVEFCFVRAHMTLAEMACLVFHFICGIPPGGLFRLPVLTHFLWWCLAWKSLWVSYLSNCCYFGSLSVR